MNELYAADPVACKNSSELKLLLASFGPYTGRYLASYPVNWSSIVEKNLGSVGDIELTRIKTLLRRATENLALVPRILSWRAEEDWLSNAMSLLLKTQSLPAVFDGLIATFSEPPTIHLLQDLDLPPTADESVDGVANEYARTSKILLLMSSELALIDPYLNPLKQSCDSVLKAIFEVAAKGRNRKISLWVRASEIFSSGSTAAIKIDLDRALHRFARDAKFKAGREIEMFLVDDSREINLHDRFLLSIKGAIQFGQGFQKLPTGRRVGVAPVGRSRHQALVSIHLDGKHDMRVVEHVTIRAS